MTVRELVRRREQEGADALHARLGVLDVLARRAPAELNFIVAEYRGGYRESKEAESQGFWDNAWYIFRRDLEAGRAAGAAQALDRMIDRVEPRPAVLTAVSGGRARAPR